MCTVLLPQGANPIAVNEYIIYHIISYISYHIYISYHNIPYHIISYHIIYHISYIKYHTCRTVAAIMTANLCYKKNCYDKLYLTTFRNKMSAVRCDYCQLSTIRASSFVQPLAKMRRGATEEEGNWLLKPLFEDCRPEMKSAVLTEFCWLAVPMLQRGCQRYYSTFQHISRTVFELHTLKISIIS